MKCFKCDWSFHRTNHLLSHLKHTHHLIKERLLQAYRCCIKEPCIWHDVEGFDITENVALDIMHDVPEGVEIYTMPKILQYLIFHLKEFSLETLNFRIRNFNNGVFFNRNGVNTK